MGPRNLFQGMNSASLCSLAGRYDNPIPNRFLAPIDCLKIPALIRQTFFSVLYGIEPHSLHFPRLYSTERLLQRLIWTRYTVDTRVGSHKRSVLSFLVYGSFSSLFMKLREKCNQFSSRDVSIYCVLLSCPPSALIPRFVSLHRTLYKYIIKALTTTKRWLWRRKMGCGVVMLLARLSAMNPWGALVWATAMRITEGP